MGRMATGYLIRDVAEIAMGVESAARGACVFAQKRELRADNFQSNEVTSSPRSLGTSVPWSEWRPLAG